MMTPMCSDRDRWQVLERLVGAFPAGMVSLVGAGPGDSALISVRGAVRLMQADVVLHDRLVGPELLDLPRPAAERIFVGKYRGEHVWTQEQINEALIRHARAGKRVVRLKGGDPFVLGRGGEECLALAEAGVRYEVVPGITAAFGAPATAGIPLTHRGMSRSFALVTAHDAPDGPESPDFGALARMGTIVLYMPLKTLHRSCEALIEAGLSPGTPAAVIHWGTRPEQRVVEGTVGDVADRVAAERIAPPAMVVIGPVVALRRSLAWFERQPLFGRTVVVTRMPDQAPALADALRAAGAEVIEAPTIALEAVADTTPVDEALRLIDACDWLVLTSANGVKAFFQHLSRLGLDARHLAGVRIAVVGRATAACLSQWGIRADLVPDEAVGEALAEAMIREGVAGRDVLLLRAEVARPELPDALRRAGARVKDVPVYRTVAPERLPEHFVRALEDGGVDWVTLTSPSSFENMLKRLGPEHVERLRKVKLASIGPVTTRAIRAAGFREAVEANPHDVPGLVSAILAAEQGGG